MDVLSELPTGEKDAKGKRMSVERIYQKKTQLEHILLRPDTYIGSVEPVTQPMWVWDEGTGMVNRDVTYVPGLYKIFDEILVNAADNKQRDPTMDMIKIDIDAENNTIQVWNNGKGIPVVEHKTEKLYVPEMIFGHLLTSSNYNDSDKKVTGGRNGYGAKLCNIFSTKFTVETSSKEYKKRYKQTWSNNMSEKKEKKIQACNKDYTCITFQPDLAKFHMKSLDKDIVGLFARRAYDVAGSSAGIKVLLNGEKLPVSNFKQYTELYTRNCKNEDGSPLTVLHQKVNPRWEICLTNSDKGFQHVAFVNSIATTKGGRHVDYVTDQVTKKLVEVVKKKNKGGVDVKPFQIKNHCWLFVNCLIENPTFDSQTKENMTLQAKKFGSTCPLSDKFLKAAASSGIVDSIMNWVKFKAQSQLNKKSATKTTKLKGIAKLDDANDAGTKHSLNCTLILTEGDSAKTLAVSGLSVVGRDKYGVFPLKGKMLNVRDANHKQIMDNAEINNIIKIMGFKYNKKYDNDEDLKTLRYGKVMIMTDQDHDGSHIKGLLINFIHANWPAMLQQRVVEEFITPIVKVTKGSQTLSFYTLPEFESWQAEVPNPKSWKTKYYKGLGTSTSKEAKSYFAEMARHRIRFKYSGPEDDAAIDMAFNKKRADDRKEWLTRYMDERRQCRLDDMPEPGSTLYSANTKSLSYSDFVNKELVMFSCADLERSVPSLVDGLKPGQRKVLFTCLKRNDKREVKVAQLAGSVAELSAYHHGEMSLMGTIINMAQNYVGSNNLNLLQPIGQFGTRLHGGKDAASPRYIFTMLSPLTRHLFQKVDDNLLTWMYDDNQRVEPMWYCPIIPMLLVNGSEGIGTGWSTKVPNHDIREVVANIRRMMDGDEPLPMRPSYKNFRGTVEKIENNKYVVSGEVGILDDSSFEITELPIKIWTQNYKDTVLEPMMMGTEKIPASITDYREYNTDVSVRFVVKMNPAKLKEAERKGLHKTFNLQNSLVCSNTLVVFDELGCLKKFNDTIDILRDFYDLRLRLYVQRKDFMIGMLEAEAKKLSNQARFILEKTEGKITIFNKAKKRLVEMLDEHGYDSDPVKAWQASVKKDFVEAEKKNDGDEEEETEEGAKDYNYILGMPLWSLTKERKAALLKQRDDKLEELETLKRKTPKDLWKADLDSFMEELEKVEDKERKDAKMAPIAGAGDDSKPGKKKMFGAKKPKKELKETQPSEDALRIEPVIDSEMRKRLATKEPKVKKEKKEKVDPNTQKIDGFMKKKTNGVKTEIKQEVDFDDMDADAPPSLMARIHNSAEKRKKKSTIIKAPSTNGKKQSKLEFKKKGKNPWETDSEDDGGLMSSDDDNNDDDDDFTAVKRSAAPKRSAAKKTFAFDDSDSDKGDAADDISVASSSKKSVESSPSIASTKSTPPASNKAISIASDDDDEPPSLMQRLQQKKTPPPAAAKKKAPVKRKAADSDEASKKKKPAAKKKAAPKSKTMDQFMKKPAAKKAKKKPAWESGSDDDAEDFNGGGGAGSSDDAADSPVKPRATTGRARKVQKTYKFSDSEEEDNDSDFCA